VIYGRLPRRHAAEQNREEQRDPGERAAETQQATMVDGVKRAHVGYPQVD
jgi:hypothetical protein